MHLFESKDAALKGGATTKPSLELSHRLVQLRHKGGQEKNSARTRPTGLCSAALQGGILESLDLSHRLFPSNFTAKYR
jgi:hypothetical protein